MSNQINAFFFTSIDLDKNGDNAKMIKLFERLNPKYVIFVTYVENNQINLIDCIMEVLPVLFVPNDNTQTCVTYVGFNDMQRFVLDESSKIPQYQQFNRFQQPVQQSQRDQHALNDNLRQSHPIQQIQPIQQVEKPLGAMSYREKLEAMERGQISPQQFRGNQEMQQLQQMQQPDIQPQQPQQLQQTGGQQQLQQSQQSQQSQQRSLQSVVTSTLGSSINKQGLEETPVIGESAESSKAKLERKKMEFKLACERMDKLSGGSISDKSSGMKPWQNQDYLESLAIDKERNKK